MQYFCLIDYPVIWDDTWSQATRPDKPNPTRLKKNQPNPTRLMRGPGSARIFWPKTRPEFYTQKIGFDPTRPDHVTGPTRANKFSPMVGSGRVQAEEKSVGFFWPDPNPTRPDLINDQVYSRSLSACSHMSWDWTLMGGRCHAFPGQTQEGWGCRKGRVKWDDHEARNDSC